jgi:hypothetical protein
MDLLRPRLRARYDFNSDFLIEMEPYVRHYDLCSTILPDHT